MSQTSFLNPRGARPPGRAARGGFTLLEILIVLTILGLLVAYLSPKLIGVFSRSQASAARIFVQESMQMPLTTYRIDMGDYPSTEDGLQALITAPANAGDRWHGPYYEGQGNKIPLDPWQRPYQYKYPGVHNKDGYDLYSLGPSGQDGASDNIGNW